MADASTISYLSPGVGAVQTTVQDVLNSLPVNALNFLSAPKRALVTSYTLTESVREELQNASNYAASQGKALYLPAGLWLIEASKGFSTGWTITIPHNKSLLIYGDGDATIIRRQAVPLNTDLSMVQSTSPLVWIKGNDGINLTFQHLLFDGNEANFPTHEGFTFTGDGFTTQFDYQIANDADEKGLSVTFIIDGVESIQNRIDFEPGGEYPNRFVRFADAPPVGTTIRLYKTFAYEQAANIKFVEVNGEIPNTITFDNVTMTGCVGDGFHANVPIQNLQVSNWRSYGRTRRPRADIQLSRIPLEATNITNFIGDAFEMEPSETNRDHIINLSNMLVRGAFDLAGDTKEHINGDAPNFANVKATNIQHLGKPGIGLSFSSFTRVRGEFVNYSFVATEHILNCQIQFTGGTFKILGKKQTPTEADHIKIRQEQPSSSVEFNGVLFEYGKFEYGKFEAGKGVTSGYFIESVYGTSDTNRIIRVINCRNLQQLDYFAQVDRCGTMIFDGGRIGGKIAALWITNGGGGSPPFVTNVLIKDPEQWSSTLLDIGGKSGFGGPTFITMTGSFNAEITQLVSNSSPSQSAHITWSGGFIGAVTSDPNGRIRGIPGLILRWAEAPAGANHEWRYKNGPVYAETVYEPA